MRRAGIAAAAVLLCLAVCLLPASAEEDPTAEAMTLPPEYTDVREHLPDDLGSLLPDDLFSSDPLRAADAIGDLTALPRLFRTIGRMTGLRLSDAAGLCAQLIGLLMLCTVVRHIAQSCGAQRGLLTGLCLRLALTGAAAGLAISLTETVRTFFSQLSDLCVGMIPLTGILYALGGNLTQSTVSQTLMITFVSALDWLCSSLSPAVCGVCMALSLLDLTGSDAHLCALGSWIRQSFSAFLGLCMFLLSAVLGTQTLLSSARDSLRMRGMRYAVGQMIPVVGGAVSASLGTLSAGIGLLRAVAGTAGILLLALLLLPTLISLLLFRRALLLCAACASLLDCRGEARFLTDAAGLYGCMAAAVTVSSVFFTIALSLLAAGKGAL